ncbi:MAG: heme biosynthesis HemY N-terminal domain-containing protein [Alphaproteobacteria bacterium]
MLRLIIFFLQLIFLLTIVSFIFSNPFLISFDINDLKYTFSSNIFIVVFLVVFLIVFILFYLFFKSRFSIRNYILKNRYKKLERGYLHFVEAMIAIANKDNKNALKSHKKMNSFLKDDPSLSLLLKSEVYKIEKNYSELSDVYETMIKSKKTEALGYRGLMEQNLKNQDFHHAFLYGEKLFNINPSIEKLYETLTYIIAKTKNWNQLITISEKAYSKKIIDKSTVQENKSIALYEVAKIQSSANIKDAIKSVTKAIDLKKNFAPFLNLHLELIAQSNNLSLLRKMIKKYWSLNSNSIFRILLIKIILDNKLDDLDFINQIVRNNKDNDESKKLLIYFAIKNADWTIARDKINGLIGSNPTREICLLMADIELGENNDKQKSDAWIMRSENSSFEDIWICKITNQSQNEWSSLSNSGYFNSLVLSNKKLLSK